LIQTEIRSWWIDTSGQTHASRLRGFSFSSLTFLIISWYNHKCEDIWYKTPISKNWTGDIIWTWWTSSKEGKDFSYITDRWWCLVGEVYKNKIIPMWKLGIKCDVLRLNEHLSDEVILIKWENFENKNVSGGIIQLPLPRKSLDKALELIRWKKILM